jgi:hypothetical protein
MGLFDDVPDDLSRQEVAAPSTAKGGLFDDVPDAPSVAEDVAGGLQGGVIRGAAGLPGLPGLVVGLLDKGADELAKLPERAYNYARGDGFTARELADTPARAFSPTKLLPQPEDTIGAVESVIGETYRPQTTAGKYAATFGEFLAGGGRRVISQALLPSVASEGAGQATEGTALEPWARGGAAIATAILAPYAGRKNAQQAVEGVLADVPLEKFDEAGALLRDAEARGVGLTPLEALAKVTGNNSLTDLQRVVESSPKGGAIMGEFMARRPGQVDDAARAEFDELAPAIADPDAVGVAAQRAAIEGVAATPEGQALAAASLPRVTPDQAGAVIQPELRRVYEGREGARAALADQDYAAARAAPAAVPLPVRSVVEDGFPGGPGRPAGLPEAPEAAPPMPTPRGEIEPAGDSLATFIAKNGGLELTGETRGMGLDRMRIPYAGPVSRPGGKSLDGYWRERLMEERYLLPEPDGTFSRDIRDELHELLRREQGGEKIYRQGTGNTRAAEARRADDDARALDDLDRARGDVARELEEATGSARGLDEAAINKLAERLRAGEQVDILDEYERLVSAGPAGRAPAAADPVPFWEAQRLGQVDASPVATSIDAALEAAKGDTAAALTRARRALHTPSGEIDATVEGLQGSRAAIDAEISKAKLAGDGNTARLLTNVKKELDRALESVPAFRQANRNFEAASRPLEPFGEGRAAAKIVERDEFDRGFTLPREKAPAAIDQGGASAAREFSDVAPRGAPARDAYEGHLATQIVDGATDAGGNLSADKLRQALRDRADVLEQFPAVRERVSNLAIARDGLARVERSPLGRIASKPDVKAAIDAVFSPNPLPGSERAVAETMAALAQRSPRAAEDLVRLHVESVFNEATQKLASGANEFGGAKFSAVLAGNSQQAKNLDAAMRALPDGAVRSAGFRRFLEVLEATGKRQAKGSPTASNLAIKETLEAGNPVADAAAVVAGGGLKIGARLTQALERYRYGRGTEELARLLTNPKATPILKSIARESTGNGRAEALALRLTNMSSASYSAAGSR